MSERNGHYNVDRINAYKASFILEGKEPIGEAGSGGLASWSFLDIYRDKHDKGVSGHAFMEVIFVIDKCRSKGTDNIRKVLKSTMKMMNN